MAHQNLRNKELKAAFSGVHAQVSFSLHMAEVQIRIENMMLSGLSASRLSIFVSSCLSICLSSRCLSVCLSAPVLSVLVSLLSVCLTASRGGSAVQ